MNKENLINGTITVEKLDNWFNSLSKKDKLAVLYELEYDYTDSEWKEYVDVSPKNTKKLSDYDDINDIDFNWNSQNKFNNMKYRKLYMYLHFNKIICDNILSLLEHDSVFYFLENQDMVEVLNIDSKMRWKYDQLVSKYELLDNDKQNQLNDFILNQKTYNKHFIY